MSIEINQVWDYLLSLEIRPVLFSCGNVVSGYDFQRHFRECEKTPWPLLKSYAWSVWFFSHLTGIWKITHTAVTFLLFKSVGELPLISVGSGWSWYMHKTLTSKFGLNLKSHIPSFFVNPTDAGFKEHLSRLHAVRRYKSRLCSSPANNALATIIENFAFLQFLFFLSLH